METLYLIFIDPFVQMVQAPDFLLQVLWEGFVSGVLYALIALGFVLIFKASGVLNFAQGIMVVFGALSLVGLTALGVPALLSLVICIGIMFVLAVGIERMVLRPLVNQPDIILFMATIGLTYFLIGLGELIFGGEPKTMVTEQLMLPTGSSAFDILGGLLILQHIDIAAAVIALVMVAALGFFFSKTRIGRALVTGIMWGARSDVSFALQIVAFKALPVIILGGLTSIPGAIVGGLVIGIGEKLGEIYWGPLVGGGIESWLAYIIALAFLLFRPQGLFGERIIERI